MPAADPRIRPDRTGGAFYELGDIHRLHGELADAEQAYQQAGRYGWLVQPGIALLRLAQGDTMAAMAAIRRALAEATDGPLYRVPGRELTRSQLLPAYVEIMVAGDDLAAADDGAAELAAIAEQYRTPALHARAAHALGSVHLARGEPDRALPGLRRACRLWHDLEAPYEAARVRVLLARACRLMQDDDGATLELTAARHAFHELGARPDVIRADALVGDRSPAAPCGLSRREVEVLRLLAADRPAVLDIHCDPEVPPIPPHAEFAEVKSMMQAMLKGDPGGLHLGAQGVKTKIQEALPGKG